jgi:hypothetical protein
MSEDGLKVLAWSLILSSVCLYAWVIVSIGTN